MMALKIASLAQGASGVRLETLELLEAMLARDVIPVVPGQGSVGASGDLAPLAHMTAAMIGVGECFTHHGRMPAAVAFVAAGLEPVKLGAKEGLALLNGTQFSTAYALAALFEAEVLFRSALVTGALSTDAARGSDAPFDPRIHALRRHRGQIETADALRTLMAGSAIRASHLIGDDRVQDPYCLRCQPQVMGACPRRVAQGGRHAGDRGQRRHRQSADFCRGRYRAVGRQFPRRAGGVRRRHDRAGGLRDRFARRAAHRHAGRPGAVRACRHS